MKKLGIGLAALLSVPAGSTLVAADEAILGKGNERYQYWCAGCHGAGPGRPGTNALAAKYGGDPPALLEERTDLTPEIVEHFVRNGISIMPFFRKTEIGDAELAAIGAYLSRNAQR